MIFWASSEVYRLADQASEKCRRSAEAYLNAALESSSLNAVEGKLRYVPIIMPEGMRENYPERSKLRVQEHIYDCAPQLDYETFVSGNFEQQLREYIRGISLSAPYLAGLGASAEQIEEFKSIMGSAIEHILAEHQDNNGKP